MNEPRTRRARLRAKGLQLAGLGALVGAGMLVAFAASGSALTLRPQQTTTTTGSTTTTSSTTAPTTTTTASTSTTTGSTTTTSTSTSTPTTTTTASTTTTPSTSTTTTTTPTGPAGQVRLANGDISIPVTSVVPPDRLVIDRVSFRPNPLRSRSAVLTGTFRVTSVRYGYRVRGALVYAIALPYGQFRNSPEAVTGTDGFASIRLFPTQRLVLKRGGSAVFFLRARKPGDNLLAGVSTRRLVQTRVAPR